jgi:hypothetical protein
MPHLQTRTLVRVLCGSFLLVTACDQRDEGTPIEQRGWNPYVCVTTNSGATLSGGSGGYGPVWPGDPDWWLPIDELSEEFVAALQEDARQRTEAFLVADFERDGGTERCDEICHERGFAWEGGGCVVGGDFAYEGLDYAEPGYNDTPRFTMTVHAEVEMGCACSE